MNDRKVSIIIPCLNERDYISGCLDSILNNDYPADKLEILIIDGISDDGTRERIKEYTGKYHNIKLLDNPGKITPSALNVGIKNSGGDVIIRMDAHTEYPTDYISKCVQYLYSTGADNVGGVCITRPASDTGVSISIALALAHPFGVGNSYFRIGVKSPMPVDTVPFGCYRSEIFHRIGLFHERLVRNQDIELNKRLIKSGGRILLVPDIHSCYYAKGTFRDLWKNNFDNGKWVILTSYYTNSFSYLSLRHFIPLGFIMYLLTLPVSFLIFPVPGVLPLALYLSLSMYFSIRLAVKENNIKLAIYLFMSFFVLHLSYGMGSIAGIFSVIKGILFNNEE